MKIFLLLFTFVVITTAQSQWKSVGNCERLSVFQTPIKDFAITEDNKYIYTLNDSGVIKKFDYLTGDTIWTKKILPDTVKKITNNWLFLSSDAKTYCTSSYIGYPSSGTTWNNYIKIFQIESDIKIDSAYMNQSETTAFPWAQYQYFTPYVDYNYSKKSLVASFYYSFFDKVPFHSAKLNSGLNRILVKKDSIWIMEKEFEGYPQLILFNKSKDLLFYLLRKESQNANGNPQNPVYNMQTSQNICYFDYNNTRTNTISEYNYYIDYDNKKTTSGKQYYFSSGFFSNDDKNIILTDKNSIYKYNLDKKDFTQILKLDNYQLKPYLISNSIYTGLFFSVSTDSINILSVNDFSYKSIFVPDSMNTIVELKNSADNKYIFMTDNNGYLFRLKNDNIFALKANFTTEDTVYMVGDTINFFDGSLGYPDKYSWDFGDGQTSNLTNPYHIFSNSGYFNIKLIITRGNLSDTVLKNKFIHIFQRAVPDFDFLITGNNPVTVNFTNKSTGPIDSVLWDFADNSASIIQNPQHQYLYSGNYKVTLKIYFNRFTSSVSKIISIEIIEPKLDNNKYFYEIIDTFHQNGTAIKGWEENDKSIIYHIGIDSLYFHGAFNINNILWENLNKTPDFVLRRRNGSYAYFHLDKVNNFDKNGEISYQNNNKYAVDLYNVKNLNNNMITSNITITNTAISYYAVIFNDTNEIENTVKLLIVGENNWHSDVINNYNFIAYTDNNKCDFLLSSYIFGGLAGIHANTKLWIYDINNNKSLPFSKFSDFIRLNDSIVISSNMDSIRIIKNFALRIDSLKIQSTCQILKEMTFNKYKFNSLLKINDSSFVAAGSYNNSPAYVIFNDKGDIIDSASISYRKGEFRFVSITPDNNLMLSGFCNKYYQYKSPYFVKTNSAFIRNLLTGQNNPIKPQILSNILCFPNPTNMNTTISFSLNENAAIRLRLFDLFGKSVFDTETKEYGIGENKIIINFAPVSGGMYYYRLEANGEVHFGKIVFFR